MIWHGRRIKHKKFGEGICEADTVGDTMIVKFDIKPPANEGMHLCDPSANDFEYLRWVNKKDCKNLTRNKDMKKNKINSQKTQKLF